MTDEIPDAIKGPTPPNPENEAQLRMQRASDDLQREAAGTALMMQMPTDIFMAQFDVMMVELTARGLIDKASYWTGVAERFEQIATSYRRFKLAGAGSMAPKSKLDDPDRKRSN